MKIHPNLQFLNQDEHSEKEVIEITYLCEKIQSAVINFTNSPYGKMNAALFLLRKAMEFLEVLNGK